MANESTQFGGSEGNKRGHRTQGARSKRTLLLEALHLEVVDEYGERFESREDAELAFLRKLIQRAQSTKDKASVTFAKEVLDRLLPTDKATMPTYAFVLDENAPATRRIECITDAVARGEIPPDVGNMLVNMVSAGVRVEETTELMERITRLEQLLLDLEKSQE